MKHIKKSPLRIFLILISALIISGQSVQAKNQFFETLYDVPVLMDLHEITEEAVAFDKPSGRIASAAAYSNNSSQNEILKSYDNALRQMGWRLEKHGQYQRDNETLVISFDKSTGSQVSQLIIRFSLNPTK